VLERLVELVEVPSDLVTIIQPFPESNRIVGGFVVALGKLWEFSMEFFKWVNVSQWVFAENS
jgi:hypothetical protein